VHPCVTVGDLLDIVEVDIAGVRKKRGVDLLYAGLWLPNVVVSNLLGDDVEFGHFTDQMDLAHIRFVTANGFPYGNFHKGSVKEKVYFPDWSQPERVEYTLGLATLMCRFLKDENSTGTLSTLPLGFQTGWSKARHDKALENLVSVASSLFKLEQSTGRRIKVCLEMEPGCVIETTTRMVELFACELADVARRMGVSEETVRQYLAVCFDVCHQAVMFEDVCDSLATLRQNEICVGKIQLSSALEVFDPESHETRRELNGFVENRYLHQVRTRVEDGGILGRMDLGEALEDPGFPTDTSWRVHFHVPVMLDCVRNSPLGTTQRSLIRVFDYLAEAHDFKPHLEVETYTWNVLPGLAHPDDRFDLQKKIAAELEWVEERMSERRLLQLQQSVLMRKKRGFNGGQGR